MKSGIELIAIERQRQIEIEGYNHSHDTINDGDQLAMAAACYATPVYNRLIDESHECVPLGWPWDGFWKPTPDDRIRELIKAGALIAAEIDRLQNI